MDRQSLIAFLLIGAILMVWLYISSPKVDPNKAAQKPAAAEVKKESAKPQEPEQKVKETKSTLDTNSAKPIVKSLPEQTVVVENDVAVVVISSKGGKIKEFFLKNFRNWYAAKYPSDAKYWEKDFQIIPKDASLDLDFKSKKGTNVSSADLDFAISTKESKISITKDASVTVILTSEYAEGKIVKELTFTGNKYDIKSNVKLENLQDQISGNSVSLVWKNGINFGQQNSVDEANVANASAYTGDEQVRVDADGKHEGVSKDFSGKIDWMAIRNKYFATIISPDDPAAVTGGLIEGKHIQYPNKGVFETYNTKLNFSTENKKQVQFGYLLYLGPIQYSDLKVYNRHFDKLVDFGNFFGLRFVIRPIAEYLLLPIFTAMYSFIPNYGIVLILFALIIKLLTYPTTVKSLKSMKQMKLLQPEMDVLRKKFADDQQKMQKEQMALYSKYGISPLGGCLPMLLQLPIFTAMYGLFTTVVDLRMKPFVGWISDLSQPDLVVPLGFHLPLVGYDHLSPLALIMGASMILQTKLAGTSSNDPNQKMMQWMMPAMMLIMFMGMPSGLNLYYASFNLFSIIHQVFYNKFSNVELVEIKASERKPGFMERMMNAAEDAQRKQQSKAKK